MVCYSRILSILVSLCVTFRKFKGFLTWGSRWRRASPLIVPTASATRNVRRNLKHPWLMMGTKITPSKESRLMTVIEMMPQIHAAGKHSVLVQQHKEKVGTDKQETRHLTKSTQKKFYGITVLQRKIKTWSIANVNT